VSVRSAANTVVGLCSITLLCVLVGHASAQELAPGLSISPDSNTSRLYPQVAPAPSLRFQLGEIIGPRDIQGGKIVPGLPQLNAMDVGAGNGDVPGRLGIGADVSGEIRFHTRRPAPERPVRMATMTPDGTTFHAPVHFEGPVTGLPQPATPVRALSPKASVHVLARRMAHRMVLRIMRRHIKRHH
jgi:hypothetical protein